MPLLSLAEVASRTGMARSSIYRLIDEGKLSATLDHRGRKAIELTEALRFFGSIQNETTKKEEREEQQDRTVRATRHTSETGQDNLFSLMQELERARAELQFKARELELKDRELDLIRASVEQWKDAHERAKADKQYFMDLVARQTLLLAAPRAVAPSRKRAPASAPVANKAATAKPAAKKVAPAKAPVKKATTKKVAPTKTPVKKATTKKVAPAKAPVKTPPKRKR